MIYPLLRLLKKTAFRYVFSLRLNVNNSSYKRKVLLTFTVAPFITTRRLSWKTSLDHEIVAISKILDDMGYVVDVVNNYGPFWNIDISSYDFVVGEGSFIYTLFNCRLRKKKLPKTIYFGTTAHPWVNNSMSNFAFSRYLRKSPGIRQTQSLRLLPFEWGFSACLADFIVAYGDNFVKKTYENFSSSPVFNIPCSSNISSAVSLNEFDFPQDQTKHVLFISGAGLLHKGFDIVIEIARLLHDYKFHIFTNTNAELTFLHKLDLPHNIICYGFVDVNSTLFTSIAKNCFCVVSPSASEGCSVALANAICSAGCIPVVSQLCGIASFFNLAVVSDFKFNSYAQAIDNLAKNDISLIIKKRIQLQTEGIIIFSRINYVNNIRHIFKEIFQD